MKIKTSTIDELCNVEYGTRVTRKKDGGKIYPVYGGGGETFFIDKTNRKNKVVIARFAMSEKCTRFIKGNFFLNDSGLTLSPKTNELSQKYLDKIILALNYSIYELGKGTAQRNLDMKQFRLFKISYPTSLAEQQRIITKLDAVFAEIDKISHSDVLNNNNREEILTNYLLKIFSNNKTEKEYELGEICKIVGGGTPSKSNPMFYEGEIPWATVRDMKKDIIQNTQYKINKEAIIKSSTNIIPKENVVIATRVGLGKVCILKNDTAINQDLKGIIPIKSKMVDINFLFYWFKSISKIIKNHGTGLTVQGVKLPFIKSLKINLPPIKEQKIIVEKIYALQSNLDAVKIIKDKRNYNLNCLRSSLLRSILNKNKAA